MEMRESAFRALIPIAFSAENIYQHLLCARSLMGNRDESDLFCAQEEGEIIETPLSLSPGLDLEMGCQDELSGHLS